MWEYNSQHCRSIINHGGDTHAQHNTRGRHSPFSFSSEEGHPWPQLTRLAFIALSFPAWKRLEKSCDTQKLFFFLSRLPVLFWLPSTYFTCVDSVI